eukprot:TRINITY_DN7829_c0_g1_i1.p1 TRINITY_DN7829_c0_g1~~TRINITY_DN7829_c0_g1_i1.p1  ORF type:complete len:317 (+),score=27.61 TRINITY_DN7829_c0_g1_i1:50-1000(+)
MPAVLRYIAVYGALLYSQTAFGIYSVVGKLGIQYMDPIIFSLLRESIAGPLLIVMAVLIEGVKPRWQDAGWFFILGATGVWGNQLFFILGLNLSGSVVASIMQPAIPVFTTALALIFRLEKPTVLKIIGIAFATAGAVVMVGFQGISLKSKATMGLIFLVANTLSMSIYLILQKPVLKRYPPVTVTSIAYIVGSCLMGLTAIYYYDNQSKWVVDKRALLPLGYAIIFPTVLTYACLTYANKYTDSSIVAASNTIQPVVSTILSYFVFPTTHIFTRQWIGGALIIAGLGAVCIDKYLQHRREMKLSQMKQDLLPGES